MNLIIINITIINLYLLLNKCELQINEKFDIVFNKINMIWNKKNIENKLEQLEKND